MTQKITLDGCGYCGAVLRKEGEQYSRRIGVCDRELDCEIAYECPDCHRREARSIEEQLAFMREWRH
jgi:hypothetical protein